MKDSTPTCLIADNKFGPKIHCLGVFDFTLLFEQAILSLLPSLLLLVVATPRILYLLKKDNKIKSRGIDWLICGKLVCYWFRVIYHQN